MGFQSSRSSFGTQAGVLLIARFLLDRVVDQVLASLRHEVCELRCNPLFVVPDSERPALLESALEGCPERRSESYRHFLDGNLCPRCKQVYEALLSAYHGDWRRLVRHVQVERVFVSRRFRAGAVVTQPQGTADAQLRMMSGEA